MNPIEPIPPKECKPIDTKDQEILRLKDSVYFYKGLVNFWFIIWFLSTLLLLFAWHEDANALKFEAAVDKEAEFRYFDTYRRRHNGSFPPEYYPLPPTAPHRDGK